MKKCPFFYSMIVMGALILLTYSCKKEDSNSKDSLIFNPDLSYGSVTDIDGNIYKTIIIGSQTWMAENLRVTHYRNGDSIPNVTVQVEWSGLTTGAYRDYFNDPNYAKTYGVEYNFYAIIDSRKLAPEGWHVPTYAEWTELVDYLGGEEYAAGPLKETGTNHWLSPNTGATNESGFTAIPEPNGKTQGTWWTSTPYTNYIGTRCGWIFCLYFDVTVVDNAYFSRNLGEPIRCIMD